MRRKRYNLNLSQILNWSHQPYTEKRIADIENRSFAGGNRTCAGGNRTCAGRSIKSFQKISSKNAISRDPLKSLVQKVTELQKEFIELEKNNIVMKKESFMNIHK